MEYQDTTKWQDGNFVKYGTLHTISSKAATTLGHVEAAILGHLWFLQNYHPKGGYIPYTEEGNRCSVNSFDQMHRRLPFISPRTLKNRIASMAKKLDGFRVFRVKGNAANHYYISPALALSLDLPCDGKRLHFHAKEATAYGLLEAIIIQHVGYCNAALCKPMKQVQRADLEKNCKHFSKRMRNIWRALRRLGAIKFADYSLLDYSDESGLLLNTWTRQMIIAHNCLNTTAKVAQSLGQSCTSCVPKLPTPLPELHQQLGPADAARHDPSDLSIGVIPLNTSNHFKGTNESKEARAAELFQVPVVPFDCEAIEVGSSASASVALPSEAPPFTDHDAGCNVSSYADPSLAEQEMAQEAPQIFSDASFDVSSVMVAAKPEPSPQIVCEGIKPQVQIPWRPNQSPYVIAPSRPIKDVDLREKNLMALFKNQMNALDLLPDESTERNFINEIRNNPEIGEEELTIIYQRTQYSETQRHSEKLAGKFDPYYHSSNLVTANQWIAKFYLILTDHYRMSAKEFFAAGKPEDELRSDTPDHVRWYIARKVSNRMLD